jgi:DNA-binding PadR family transcriptional regulator
MDISSPLRPALFHILLALAEGDLHGYGIMQAIRAQSDGRLMPRTGSFYPQLARLMEADLVSEAPSRRPGDDPRRGAYYRLTPRGRRVLEAEKQRLADLVASLRFFPAGASSRRGRA